MQVSLTLCFSCFQYSCGLNNSPSRPPPTSRSFPSAHRSPWQWLLQTVGLSPQRTPALVSSASCPESSTLSRRPQSFPSGIVNLGPTLHEEEDDVQDGVEDGEEVRMEVNEEEEDAFEMDPTT